MSRNDRCDTAASVHVSDGVSPPYAEIAEKLVAAMRGANLEAILALLHPSIEVFEAVSLPYGGTWHGHDGFTTLLEQLLKLGGLSIGTAKIHEIDHGVIMELPIIFTSQKDGEVLHTSVVEIDRFDGSLVREIDIFYKDTAAINDYASRQLQLGSGGTGSLDAHAQASPHGRDRQTQYQSSKE
jgi:hypothetical protein